ncbi:unnamed protein product [Heligmosomoides polygyrus]|uniref:Thiamine-phosphate synthase n=1 Tax=Heligmosomoides polygyrus TaxID=6339 RepID=A0A183FHK0_HELPZ|nr:unnamed protein product [Heligmosomoides polygyrus]
MTDSPEGSRFSTEPLGSIGGASKKAKNPAEQAPEFTCAATTRSMEIPAVICAGVDRSAAAAAAYSGGCVIAHARPEGEPQSPVCGENDE